MAILVCKVLGNNFLSRRRRPVLLAAFIFASFGALAEDAERPKTAPSEPVAPRVQERDVKSLSEEQTVKQWKPGDPVKVMPDLREEASNDEAPQRSQPKAIVYKPVAPKVSDVGVNELPKVKPYKAGDPIRVVPDLRVRPETL